MSARAPRVSVILPAYHSDETIGGFLQALRDQTWQDFETIVVNSSPEDCTRQIVTTQFPEIIFTQSATRLLPHAARNVGVSLARGEHFVFTDPDCLPRTNWLEELLRAVEQGHPVVLGSVDLASSTWRERGIHLCKRFMFLRGLPAYTPWVVSTVNACYTRRAWDAAGPFAGNIFCADALLSWRAREKGYSPWFEPQAIVVDTHSASLTEFVRERFERGAEFAQVRAQYEHWSRWRALGYALAIPVLLAVILRRTHRAARMAGIARDFWLTLPIVILGQLAWLLGESKSYLAFALLNRISNCVLNHALESNG